MTQEMMEKYKKLVENNGYSELLVEVAKDNKLDYYKVIFESLLKIHNTEGQLSSDIHAVRTRFKDEMLISLKNQLSENDFELISAFV